jgi:hypothetical protein
LGIWGHSRTFWALVTAPNITDRLTQEVERLLAENERLAEEKRKDVGIWLRAQADYQETIRIFREENAALKRRLEALEGRTFPAPSNQKGERE